MIYLDNAATSFPKPASVIADLTFCLKKYCGNPGRSSHVMSLMAADAIYSAREEVAGLIGVDTPEQIVFTYNATHALNLAIKTMVTERCHILTSDLEHNSVIRPLSRLAREVGIEVGEFSTLGDVEANIRAAIREDTRGIVSSICSNVTGERVDISLLSRICAEKGIFLIIDASQSLGHTSIDLKKTPCDVLCGPGHKGLYGIQGCGFAYFRDNKRRESFIEGGSGSESISPLMPELLPEAYEAGTLSTPAIVSLGSGIRFVKSMGIEAIERRMSELTDMLTDRLSSIKSLTIYGAGSGILSFNITGFPSSAVAMELDKHGICVRAGLHCAPSIHRRLGTIDIGAVRASFSVFTTQRDIDELYLALREIGNV